MEEFNLKKYITNPSRKVVTRSGKPVRIVCTDARGEFPVVGVIYYNDEKDIVDSFTENGKWANECESDLDLFFALEKREGWVCVYRNERGNIFFSVPYCTKQEAIDALYDDKDTHIDTIKVTWKE